MLLVSQNLLRHNMIFPEGTVLRINLAWVSDLSGLETYLEELESEVFLDYPVGRSKPPNNMYSISELKRILNYDCVKYLAISNVESSEDIMDFLSFFSNVTIVPKIESKKGIENLKEISSALPPKKVFMLDHDDLYSDLISKGVSSKDFFSYIDTLDEFCRVNSISLLRTRGVIFSDSDTYNYKNEN